MLVKDIIKKSAEILELNDILDYFADPSETPSDEVAENINRILLAINITNNTIASQYFEIVKKVTINCADGIVPFSDISSNEIVEIKNVQDLDGKKIKFRVMADGVYVECGTWDFIYSYLPDTLSETSDIDYYTKVGSTLFAYGVVAEYLFLNGDINNAYFWDKRFKEELFSLSRPRRCINMPSKRWY